ncbi:MFS transporter [Lacticaseibacillus yichunensis]|uniref:MFS transporter n=1 Tax=Lacticaseibacillus yichunensis TaxID=2486015 RepID=A0ABW4CQW9_9LACO|nr:MFS transporter [Lacticaseibacillus yichunensis]
MEESKTAPSLWQHARLITGVGVAWLFDAMDVGMLSFILAAVAPEWHLTATQSGLIGSISSLGMALGAVLFGMMADRIGRKAVLIITLLVFSMGSALSALANGYVMFMALRFIIGAGLGGELPVASTLVSESVAPQHRGRSVVLLESFWAVGWLLAALVSYFVIPHWGWRVSVLITGCTALYALYFRGGINESPVFEAEKPQRRSFFSALRALWQPQLRRATAMLWIVWFMVVFSYYGMFLWLPSVMVLRGYDLIHSFGYTLLMTLAQLPGYFVAAWLIEKWGRKPVLIVFLTGTELSALAFGAAANLAMLLTAGALLSFFNLGAWGALYAYSPEQYPDSIRSSGSGMAAGVGRLGGIVGPLATGAMVASGVSFTAIFGLFTAAVLIGAAAVAWLGRETLVKAR